MTRTALALLLLFIAIPAPFAAPADNAEPLAMGVFPRRPAALTRSMFAPLAAELSRQLQRPVRLMVAPDFVAFQQALAEDRYQLVHYNPYHYLRAHALQGHRLVAMNEEHGSNRIRAAVWVRRDSGIHSPEDLRHLRITFGGGRDAMVSHIMTADLLQRAGLPPGDYSAQYTINPTRALMAVFYRQSAAAGLNASAILQDPLRAAVDASELKQLMVGEAVAHHPWAVSAKVDGPLQQRITRALLGMKDSEAGRAALASAGLTGLDAANDADYDPHRRIVARVLDEHY